jgi:hypothetical protein
VLIVISDHRWGRDLGSADGESYDVEEIGEEESCGNVRLEKEIKTNQDNVRLEKEIKPIRIYLSP